MSAISALKGYRTQFLYSLHYILSTLQANLIYRLEGEEDLDILDSDGQLLYAIQLKNLGKTLTLSDILSNHKTSFIKRFLDKYSNAVPILVSYGEISKELKSWIENQDSVSGKEKTALKKYNITEDDWKLIKSKIKFTEVSEETIAEEVEKMLKNHFPLIDPIPTTGFLLNWLQFIAEKQKPVTTKDFYHKIEDFAEYIAERIAIHDQYGLVLQPLHKISTDDINTKVLENEFYNATLTRYEHILLGLEVNRDKQLAQIDQKIKGTNTIILKGASGQGKTALLYSYVHHYVNDWLSFELNIQQEPIITQQAIKSIASISKKLEIPTVIIINVNPNTTEWLKVIKQASRFNHIKFLVAIRNEDWYRASAIGVEFEHTEIDLSLSKEEAEIIYSKLNERNKISHFTDFEEAWIQLGGNPPLLEFVYSITQGESLLHKLKQQIQQILREENLGSNPQIEFLRIVSIADAVGARIDVSNLNSAIDYQFIIEKLENEYLIKKSSDRKYIQGLHIIRSQKLVEILFDEFTNCKEDYAYKCIPLIAEQDLYLFLLQLFHLEIFKSKLFITSFQKEIQINKWSIQASIIKALIWVGTKEYVENNRQVIDECRAICGGAWMMFTDFMFSSDYDRHAMLDLLKADDEKRKKIDEINKRLLSNQSVFNLVANVIDDFKFPSELPSTVFEWKSFGEVLFWLSNIPNNREQQSFFTESEFTAAFKIMDTKSLSKLMLGMYSYSPELDAIRKKNVQYFIDRVKMEFDIIHLSFDGDEVYVHYIIDALDENVKRTTNDFVVNILDIIRTALPEKKKFNSQGYGHRLQTLSIDYDTTHKTMPVENMPLEEWVNINSCILKLYEYKDRPENWIEYVAQLNQWEKIVKEKISEFNLLFEKLFNGSKNYMPVIPVIQNINFEISENVKAPKSISDPLGIYAENRKGNTEDEKEKSNEKIRSKYEMLFKSVSDFKGSIENFIQQSAQTTYSKGKLQIDDQHNHNDHIEYLSQTNLYSSIEKLKEYNNQYHANFRNIDVSHKSKIETELLLTTATIWKDYLNNNSKGERSFKRIYTLKSDFENKIIKDFKNFSKSNPYSITYINNQKTNDKPIVIIDSKSPFWSLIGYKEAYEVINQAINNPEYTSLKYLMLQLWFSDIYFIQTVSKKSINSQWIAMRLYTIRDKKFEELSFINSIPQKIDQDALNNLDIESWSKLYPEFNQINQANEAYGKVVLLVDHLYDLRSFDQIELSDFDQKKLYLYFQKINVELQQSFQTLLNSLVGWTNTFPFDENTYLNNEEEQEYFTALFRISDHIFPEPKGEEVEYHIELNMEIISKWVERLKVCTQSWGIFIMLLYGKYIDLYQKNLAKS